MDAAYGLKKGFLPTFARIQKPARYLRPPVPIKVKS
jgi:hypothetical protein